MADARVPPPGPPLRDPTAPARLLDAAAEIGFRVERAHRQLDGLSRSVERLAGAATPQAWQSAPAALGPPPSESGEPPFAAPGAAAPRTALHADARAFAIDLAVGGASRDAIRGELRRCFGLDDPDALLAEISTPRSSPSGDDPAAPRRPAARRSDDPPSRSR